MNIPNNAQPCRMLLDRYNCFDQICIIGIHVRVVQLCA